MAHPECREQVTNACDIGTPTSQLKAMYPQLDWSLLQHEIWWYLDEKSASEVTVNNYQEHFRSHRYEEPEGMQWPFLHITILIFIDFFIYLFLFLGYFQRCSGPKSCWIP